MAGVMRAYLLQMYGFVVKTYTLRWRTPVATSMEVLLPFIFMLLLSVCYWTTPSTLMPEQHFDLEHVTSPPFNNSEFTTYYFCTHPEATRKLPWQPCNMSDTLHCLRVVGNGKELCLGSAAYAKMAGLSMPMRYASGPLIIDSLDGYLAVSAFFTETTKEEMPTFFGRTIRASLSHYGKLLVASENGTLARQFMSYCVAKSAMCGEVLHPTAFASHDDAVAYATANENTVWAIVYLPPDALDTTPARAGEAPRQSEFAISMNYSATPATFTSTVKSFFTHELDQGASSTDYTLYHGSGFATLQLFVRDFYLSSWANTLTPVGPASAAMVSRFVNQYGLRILPMPIPEHFANDFMTRWTYYLPLLAMIAALFPVARLTGLIVEEKAHGIREAMMIMGMHRSCHFAGWYATALLIDLVAALLATMIMKVGFLGNTDYGVLLGVYFTFLQQNSAMCFLISTIFSNPRIAAWCAALTVFLLAMPFYSFPDGMTTAAKLGCAMFPGVGYAEAFELMTNYAKYNTPFTYATAGNGEYCVNHIVAVMWASFAAMSVLALYLDRVAPAAVGVPEHPLFFLAAPLRWLRRRCSCNKDIDDDDEDDTLRHRHIAMADNVADLRDDDDDEAAAALQRQPVGMCERDDNTDDATAAAARARRRQLRRARAEQQCRYMEHSDDVVDTADSRIAAVVHKLRKVYIGGGVVGFFYTFFTGLLRRGDRVAALDGVTFAMRTGEVNVLLGPNGAGKTTLISALCGMLTPTAGDVYIRGHRIATHLAACRRDVGFCPQSNIVWPELTVDEHVTFYARLKATRVPDTRAAVQRTLELVNLTDKRHCRAAQLSGGQCRRLCLAMALVGEPAVLLLDEPTAGMDMQGRQVMYEVLRRARAHRSVLLSTHLLDEADRVGDRVLLLHRGRLVAEGAPMFLKSQMRVGYVVTCVLNSGLGDAAAEDAAVNALIAYVHDKGYSGHRTLDACTTPQALPPHCSMLGIKRRGREVSFRFDLSLLTSSGRQLLSCLEADRDALQLRSVGLSLATLTDVFSTITQGQPPLDGDDKARADEQEQQQQQQEEQQKATTTTTMAQCPYAAHATTQRGDDEGAACGGYYYSQTQASFDNNNNDNNNDNDDDDEPQRRVTDVYASTATTTKPVASSAVLATTTDSGGSSANKTTTAAVDARVCEGEVLYETDSSGLVVFARQFRALFIKRMHFARRDVKLMVFQIALPVIFLLLSMLVNLTRAPAQPNLLLDMTMYSDYARNPAEVHAFVPLNFMNALSLNATTTPSAALGAHLLLNVTSGMASTAYSGKPLPDAAKQMMELYSATLHNHTRPHYFGLMPSAMYMVAGPPTMRATVLHNMSYSHAVPQGIDALFNLATYQMYGSAAPRVVTRNAPLHFGEYERQLYETSKPVLMGMFLILPFILIPSQTISYIVRENECGARHMQWLTGVSVLAYWLSCFVFDAACYVCTEVLTFCVLGIFHRTEYVGAESLAPSLVLFLFFGISSIPLSYMLSFAFKSPFAAQTTVLVVNFAFGFLWVTMESMLAPHAFDFVRVVTYIVRALPAVSFGEGVYILSGNALGRMLAPVPIELDLWAFVQFQAGGNFVGGVGTALVYMGCVCVASTLLLVVFEYLRIQNASRYVGACCGCCYRRRKHDEDDDNSDNKKAVRRGHGDNDDDASVREEVARVCDAGAGGPASDLIAMQHLSKQYWMARQRALDDVTLGVRRGEVVSLLGLNGAGKSTALSILAGDVAATSGQAYVNHVSVRRPAGRVFVGYCPQYDALLDRLTPREHLWLYARLRGVREAHIAREVDVLLHELGLHPHRHQPACTLSGGNKRRLSLAIALVGRTTSVLLDEPTAGMDAQARAQMCAVVRQLTRSKAVLLTTHLIDEVDALADRVAFLSRGKLRCLGTPQELKSRSSERAMTTMTMTSRGAREEGSGYHHDDDDEAAQLLCMPCYYIHVLFPRHVTLLPESDGDDAAAADGYVDALQRHAAAVMRRGDNSSGADDKDAQRALLARVSDADLCSVRDVRVSSLTLQVRGRLSNVCTLVVDLHQGAVRGVPLVSYVGVTQPGLEDVLLDE